MEAIMWFEKENGDLGCLPSKANRGPSAQLSKGFLQVPKGKNFSVAKPQALRKALGNINQHVQPKKSASKKVVKKDNLVKQRFEKYPEIEKFIPYNPLDFETFDVPEEHKLSDRCLAGVPLLVLMDDTKNSEALNSPVLPMEIKPINYDSFEISSYLFEDIPIDLPYLCNF
ncbi:securin-like [Hyla sarda]|uniref:securin-like n=1 Tax=Hyla sarda TaxID=327740 RepID=UPI0024C2AFCC|nr:securin-like [Hyla sarda]